MLMHYINRRFTYLLTLTDVLTALLLVLANVKPTDKIIFKCHRRCHSISYIIKMFIYIGHCFFKLCGETKCIYF